MSREDGVAARMDDWQPVVVIPAPSPPPEPPKLDNEGLKVPPTS